MSNLTVTNKVSTMESAAIVGDLSKLTPEQRMSYYMEVCKSTGLNPLTRPFDYITLNGKLTLYARKDASEQLRKINGISIDKPDISYIDDWIVVTVSAHDQAGRSDSDIGVVSKKDMRGDFGNALMKAITKAKRRVTLSICGLGWLDETEVETIPDAKPVIVTDEGEIIEPKKLRRPEAEIIADMGFDPKPAKPAPADDKPSDKTWEAWYALVAEADVLGISVPEPADNVTYSQLTEQYKNLKQEVKNRKEQATLL